MVLRRQPTRPGDKVTGGGNSSRATILSNVDAEYPTMGSTSLFFTMGSTPASNATKGMLLLTGRLGMAQIASVDGYCHHR
jgi:hypothetical protein